MILQSDLAECPDCKERWCMRRLEQFEMYQCVACNGIFLASDLELYTDRETKNDYMKEAYEEINQYLQE